MSQVSLVQVVGQVSSFVCLRFWFVFSRCFAVFILCCSFTRLGFCGRDLKPFVLSRRKTRGENIVVDVLARSRSGVVRDYIGPSSLLAWCTTFCLLVFMLPIFNMLCLFCFVFVCFVFCSLWEWVSLVLVWCVSFLLVCFLAWFMFVSWFNAFFFNFLSDMVLFCFCVFFFVCSTLARFLFVLLFGVVYVLLFSVVCFLLVCPGVFSVFIFSVCVCGLCLIYFSCVLVCFVFGLSRLLFVWFIFGVFCFGVVYDSLVHTLPPSHVCPPPPPHTHALDLALALEHIPSPSHACPG